MNDKNKPIKEGNKTYFTKHSLFMNQAPSFNFEMGGDELLKRALEIGFVTKVGEDKYLMNENYGKVFNYEGWLSALDFAEELGCPDSKGWEDKLDALEDAGTSDGAVDAFEGTAIEFIKSKGYKIMEDGKEVFND